MTWFWLALAFAIPTAAGWLLVRVAEGKYPVLLNLERIAMGAVVGPTLGSYLLFLGNVAGMIGITRTVVIAVMGGMLIVSGIAWFLRGGMEWKNEGFAPAAHSTPVWQTGILAILGVWTIVKFAMAAVVLVGTPAYLDDTIDNWNLRAKVFVAEQHFTLALPIENGGTSSSGVSSYPPTVPLVKAWAVLLRGSAWEEDTANGVHLLWTLACIGLVWGWLRRTASRGWALIGVYVLTSLPLFLIQGFNAYGDVFLASHIIAVVSMLTAWMCAHEHRHRMTAMRLAVLTLALLPFTKNEALLLYLPPMLLIVAIGLWHRMREAPTKEMMHSIVWFTVPLLAVLLPWLIFKWMHDLPFGNAKAVSGFAIEFEPMVPFAIAVNTFIEGNWLLFFPILLVLLALRWYWMDAKLRMSAATFFLLAYVGQIGIYTFTSLSNEALRQTGYARGLIHIVPVAVVLAILLARDWLSQENTIRHAKEA